MRNPLEQNKIPLSHAGFFQTLAIKTKSIYNTNYMMNPEEKKLKDNAKVVPLIALRGLVVFPNTTITVDVGRPKSVRALEEALRRDGKLFFAAQKELINIDPSKEEIFDVGTVCDVLQKIDLPNNNVRLLIKGQYKAKVVEYLKENDYFSVAVEELENKNSDTIVTQALLRQARELLATLCVNVPNKINKELLTKLADTYEPNQYADLICHLIIYQDKLKQKLLEIDDTQVRLEELCKIIASETEIAKVEKKISAQVKQSIDKGQKEYYLKEQMKAISHELGEDADEIAQYEKKIRSAKMPAEVEEKALKELKRLEKMAPTSPDATVSRSYIEWLTDLAWDFQTEDNKDLERAKKILDEDHFGLDKIKERILEYLAVMQLTGTLNGPILCFVGPPGVGKTSIAKSIARCLDRVFERMSLGGVRDEAEIRGHRRTYIGAIPGKIIYLMKQAGCKNPVLLLDEIDKMSSDMRGDPASAMLEVLDPEQNNTFTDHYLEAPYDLSKVLFIATANKVDTIPAPLLDRMEIIELTGYTEEEKMEIAKKFLIGKQEKQHGIPVGGLSITDDALRKIIRRYTRESGVRTLEREIARICRKTALLIVEKQDATKVITPDNLSDYLGVEKFKEDELDTADEVGSATGLAWTAVGGTTLTIDVTLFEGKGDILLTGMMGDVMKESARTAISHVKSSCREYGIDPSVFAKTDIHIHIPEGAIPKDGPSAGITMATAIMSAFTHRAVSKKVAMTGEVTLRGKVLPIGGLKEKTLAAYRVGIRKIIIPKDNEKDLQEIPQEVLKNINVVLSDNINTVFRNSLV